MRTGAIQPLDGVTRPSIVERMTWNDGFNVFNRTDRVVEGWYWTLPSSQLKRGQVRAVTLMGKELVLFRGESGTVVALDAYCPHMGAHLKEGRVEGDSIRCLFHHWKYDARGVCTEIPCQERPVDARI